MRPRLCSYDMATVPDDSFLLKDEGGEMYFCDLRCLCVWSVQLATRQGLSEVQRSGTYLLTMPVREEHQFEGIGQVARWATDRAVK